MQITKHLAYSVLDALKKRKQNSLRKLNDRILKEAAINFTRQIGRAHV